MIKIFNRINKRSLLPIAVFLVGLLAGWMTHEYFLDQKNVKLSNVFLEERSLNVKYPYVNPLVECEMGESITLKPLQSFKQQVEDLIREWKKDDDSLYVAVYFRNMNDGPSFGIHEHERFLPGSLLKVPTMMGFLKEAEDNPVILQKNILNKLDQHEVPFQVIEPSERIIKGQAYTVEELIKRMIRYSDNVATGLLNTNGGKQLMDRVYDDFGLPKENSISIKQYTRFFKVLFNASYLDKKYSNHALSLLSQSEFKSGLVAGLPMGTKVAHKFGEQGCRTDFITDEYDWAQLHDCGIIYYPNNPYLLCIMTRGKRLEQLAPVIADISKLVYKNVDQQMKEKKQSNER